MREIIERIYQAGWNDFAFVEQGGDLKDNGEIDQVLSQIKSELLGKLPSKITPLLLRTDYRLQGTPEFIKGFNEALSQITHLIEGME